MLSSHARATSLATLLAIGGLGALAMPAHAADGATITVGSDDVWVGDKLDISGTCPSSSRTAVITVEQEEGVVALGSANVTGGAFKATVDLKKAYWGPATASVDCLAYAVEKPVAHATTDFFIDDEDWPFEEIEVAISQQEVALGGTLSVSATCPKGSDVAAILAGNEKADEAFFEQEVTPAASGAVSARIKIAATDGVEPEVGTALAVVVCGDDDVPMPQLLGDKAVAGKLLADAEPMTAMALEEMFPTALGVAEFTITPAVAAPSAPTAPGTGTVPAARGTAPSSTRAASAAPQLAYTGSEPAPLAAIALAMIAAGGVAIRRARRA